MSRYLTPARICALTLFESYQLGDVWNTSPHTASTILQIVAEQCLQPHDATSIDTTIAEDVLIFGRRLSSLETQVPGRTWLSILVRKIWEISSVDELNDLFERTFLLVTRDPAGHLTDTGDITRASPIGQFIRRCKVEFTRLQFAESLSLWNAFLTYREPSRAMWTQQYPQLAKNVEHYEIRTLEEGSLVSTDVIDTALTASVSLLQKQGQRVPGEVKLKMQSWLTASNNTKSQSLHHFMSFYDAWRAGQYNLALENLHRYFDYSVAKGSGEDTKVYYQYALLHLSVLHADFEHWDESVSAMKECIATARENQDAACLNFALSWLLYLRQSRPIKNDPALQSLASIAGEGGNEQDEIAFLKAKARDSKHWTLMSSTLLEEAKFELRHHGISNKAVELVLQSSYLNTQHASYSVMPATAVFQAALFDRLGQSHLARSIHESTQQVNAQHCSLTDHTRIICRLAYHTTQLGRYNDGIAMLKTLRTKVSGTLKLDQRVSTFAELLALMRAVRRSDMEAANYHMINLRPVRDFVDPDMISLCDQLEIALLIKQCRHDVALEKLNKAIDRAKLQEGDVAEMLSLLIQKANVFASSGRPTKGFSIAVRAAARAQQCNLVLLFTESLLAIARILNELAEFPAARKLCESALPSALESSNMLLVADLFVTLGESCVGMIPGDTKQVQLAHTASSYIERAREVYAKIEEYEGQLDCLLMQSRLAQFSDDTASAEALNAKYNQLVTEHENMIVK